MSNKDTLKVKGLTERISQLVAQYEEQLIDYRAEATIVIQELNTEIESLRQRVAELEADGVVAQEADATVEG